MIVPKTGKIFGVIAPLAQLVTLTPSDGWVVGSKLDAVTRSEFFCPTYKSDYVGGKPGIRLHGRQGKGTAEPPWR